ncbi:MAG TPA: MFS transporter [Patescibacteria group bacterium]
MRKEITYLMLIFLLAAGSASGFLLLLPFITKDLHLSLTQTGIIAGAFSLSRIFAVVPLTSLAPRLGSIPMLLIATLIYGLGFLSIGLSNFFLFFVIVFLLSGTTFSIFQPIVFGLSTRLSSDENRGRVIGFVTSGSDLGRIGIAGAISFLATQFGFRVSSIIAAVTIIIFLILAYLKKPNIAEEKQIKETHLLKEAKTLSKNTFFLLTSVVLFFDTIASATLFVYLPFLMFYRHISISLMPILITVFFIGSLTGKLYLGKLTDKFQNTVVFITAESLMAIFLIIIANVTSPILFAVISFFLGMLTKGTVPASVTMASESVKDTGNFENAYAFNYVILSIANTITPVVVGFIADHSNISISFYFCALSALIATIPAILFHKKRERKKMEEVLAFEKSTT